MNWQYKGVKNNLAKKHWNPRISLIVAVDSKGEVFCSLTQANMNSQVIGLFFKHLSIKLDVLRPNWRKTHVILVDNAPYHSSKQTL